MNGECDRCHSKTDAAASMVAANLCCMSIGWDMCEFFFCQDRNLVTHCLQLRFSLLVGEYAAVVALLPWHKYLHEFVVASDIGWC